MSILEQVHFLMSNQQHVNNVSTVVSNRETLLTHFQHQNLQYPVEVDEDSPFSLQMSEIPVTLFKSFD